MRLPIDAAGMTFLCAVAASPVLDFESRRQRADVDTGEALYALQLLALNGDAAEIVKVTVAGEPKVTAGQPVKVAGLTANYWAMGDRSGLSFRAAKVEPVAAPARAAS
jgi:hypothetical protein